MLLRPVFDGESSLGRMDDAMEGLLLLLATGLGKAPALKPVVADLVQKVSWSALVCVGIAVGTAAPEALGKRAGR